MSLIAVFPNPPPSGDITLCEYNTQYVSEDFERADLKKYVPATHVSSCLSIVKKCLFLVL